MVTPDHSVARASTQSLRLAVSTMVFGGDTLEEMIQLAITHDLILEFSSGLPHRPDLEALYRKANCARLPHNYFPAPEKPFLLNLSSLNDELWQLSVDHCRKGLDLAATSGAPFFSAHAGYCGDPDSRDLGKKMATVYPDRRSEYWERFLEAVHELAAEAERRNVKFLIENHVVIAENTAGENHPFLCATADEILRLRADVGPSIGLLLDTGHLKVTARSLGFDRNEFVLEVADVVDCIHHSDNDGVRDTNELLSLDYWFLTHMPMFGHVLHVLETQPMPLEDLFAQRDLLAAAGSRISNNSQLSEPDA